MIWLFMDAESIRDMRLQLLETCVASTNNGMHRFAMNHAELVGFIPVDAS
jgi:hypothetical protein